MTSLLTPVSLTGADIKKYFDPQNLLTDKQVGQALALCKGRNLNPFANEVYIVAYKNRNGGTEFSLIVSKEAFLKRAAQCKDYEGFEAGVVAVDSEGVMHERKGGNHATRRYTDRWMGQSVPQEFQGTCGKSLLVVRNMTRNKVPGTLCQLQ